MNDPTRADLNEEDRKEAAKRLRAAATALRHAAGQVSHAGDTVYFDAFIDHLGKIIGDLKKAASEIAPTAPRGAGSQRSKAIPVVIHDIEYPSMAAAARAYQVPLGTVKLHLEAGTLDEIGTTQIPARAITIRGVEYPSMKAAARALHVRVNTVRKNRDAGTLDQTGLKKRNRKSKTAP